MPFIWLNWHNYIDTVAGQSKTTQHWVTIVSRPALLVDLIWFSAALVTLHFATAAFAVALSYNTNRPQKPTLKSAAPIFFFLTVIQIGWSFRLFPNSLSSITLEPIILTAGWMPLFITAHAVTLVFLASKVKQLQPKYQLATGALIILLTLILAWTTFNDHNHKPTQMAHSRPNIIVIGLDSLRPDFIDFLKEETNNNSAIAALIDESTYFTNTITPLARTFPAWLGILSGRHTYYTGAIDNLINPDHIKADSSIAWELQGAGYETLYSTDERRFSNIDERFGFKGFVGPKIGALDFILGAFTDFPLANILSASPFGQYFFPYSYLNRAAAYQYRPKLFVDQTLKHVNSIDSGVPLFLSTHFCLAHWPYAWSGFNPGERSRYKKPGERNNFPADYRQALLELDSQVEHFLNGLKASGRLANSLIITLSDHGEGLGLTSDALTAPVTEQNINLPVGRNPGGHGSDVLSPAHHRVVLAIKVPDANVTGRKSDAPASLLDIAPTIRDIAGIPPQPSDGLSLNPLLSHTHDNPPDIWSERVRFWESGFRPKALLTTEIRASAIAQEQARHYEVLDNGWLAIKNESLLEMQEQKQIAVNWRNWVVAATNDDNRWHIVVADWSDMSWNFFAESPLNNKSELLEKLCDHAYLYELNITPHCQLTN